LISKEVEKSTYFDINYSTVTDFAKFRG
jgi:hypothetical protein